MQISLKPVVLQLVAVFLVFAFALFLPAGTLAWPAGWIFLILFFGSMLFIYAWLYLHNPGLLRERTHLWTTDQQAWDKILFPVLLAFFLAWLVLMPLDAVRFHWSALPVWLQASGALLLFFSFYLLFMTFRENAYLSPVIRIQEERGQTVISTGPYHYVRHPMYCAILLLILGTSLLLGSAYGILLGLAGIALLARRAVLEERALEKAFPGYRDYQARVKYRLVPYIW